MQFQDLRGLGMAVDTHLRDMYEPVFVKSHVYESPEIGDIRHYSRQFHAGIQVLKVMYIL